MRIFIKYGYRGAPTNEVYLPVGEHEVDPGLAAYLVEAGHAAYVGGTPAPPTPVEETDTETPVTPPVDEIQGSYDEMTLAALVALADVRGIVVEGTGQGGRVLKADVIAALEATDADVNADTLDEA